MDRDQGFSNPKPKVQGNWKCSGCGAAITELPFEPTPGRDVFCANCFKPRNNTKRPSFGRPKVRGEWKCAGCGKTILELPFRPNGSQPIYCTDCFRKDRA